MGITDYAPTRALPVRRLFDSGMRGSGQDLIHRYPSYFVRVLSVQGA